jgi:hypothetical protein
VGKDPRTSKIEKILFVGISRVWQSTDEDLRSEELRLESEFAHSEDHFSRKVPSNKTKQHNTKATIALKIPPNPSLLVT